MQARETGVMTVWALGAAAAYPEFSAPQVAVAVLPAT